MQLAHQRPEMLFSKVTNSRLTPFCFLIVEIGPPFRSVTGSSPSANARQPHSTSADAWLLTATVKVSAASMLLQHTYCDLMADI